MNARAIIGGSGLNTFPGLTVAEEIRIQTPYGMPSGPILKGEFSNQSVYFLARHGAGHTIPPHRINYRANIYALKSLDVSDVVAVTAVGGIAPNTPPQTIAIPHQLIDYTYGREHTFSDGIDGFVQHVDFTHPFTSQLRLALIAIAHKISLTIIAEGVYGATMGPRLESAAEIVRMAGDGCSLVGMTAMPEAALAREAGLNYANCSLVVNWAAGIGEDIIELAEIEEHLALGMVGVVRLLRAWLDEKG